MDDPSMMPDLSHLSAEEREIIEQVFKRQRDEEEKETQISQKASEELTELNKQINERKETSRKLIGTQDDAICQICQKTKFADGIGHKCFYCQLRSCARCGGRAQSKNKAIWACSLCQKRQQILAKTGKWFQPEEPIQPKLSVSGATPTSDYDPMLQDPMMNNPEQQMIPNQNQFGQSGPMQQTPQMQMQMQQQQQRQAEPPDKMQHPPPNQQQQQQQQQQQHHPQQMGPNGRHHQEHQHQPTQQQQQPPQSMNANVNQNPNQNQNQSHHPNQRQNSQNHQLRHQGSIQNQQHPQQQAQQPTQNARMNDQSGATANRNSSRFQQPQQQNLPNNHQQQQQQPQSQRMQNQNQQQGPNQSQNLNQNHQNYNQNTGSNMNASNQNHSQGQGQMHGQNSNQQNHQQNQNQQQYQQQNMPNDTRMDNNRMRDDGGRREGGMFRQQSVDRNSSQTRYQQDESSNQRPTFFAGNNPANDSQYQSSNSQQGRKNVENRVTEEDYSSSANFEAKKQRNFVQNQPSQQNQQGVRACPPSDDHLSRVKNRLHRQLRSMSSSEEDIHGGGGGGSTLKMSTSAVVAAGGKTYNDDMGASNVQRLSEECNSEKDLLRYIYGDVKHSEADKSMHTLNSMKGMQARRRDKSISISPSRNMNHHGESTSYGSPNITGGDLLATKIRTFLSHPVTWQPSADQKRLIGHMILHRTENSASNGDLGLKIVGGRRTDTGKLGAFITQVKPGSVADTIGRLRPGDEVVEWNGQSLQNATYEHVYDSIASSRYDTQVELIVSRSAILPGGDDFLNMTQMMAPNSHHRSSHYAHGQGPSHSQNHAGHPSSHYHGHSQRQLPNPELFMGRDLHATLAQQQQQQFLSHSQSANFAPNPAFSARNRSTSSYNYPDVDLGAPSASYRDIPNPQAFGTGHIFGRIEVSFVYSHHDRQLSVALERAYDLPPRPDGTPRNPYVKIFLLPDRSEKSRRQSAVIAETLMPVWNEVFYYNGLAEPMILQRVLEMTVWDYDKFGTNSFLGETLIDLASVPLDGEHSLMCTLVDMDDDNPLRTRLKLRKSSYNQPVRRPQSELNYYDHHGSYYNAVGVGGMNGDEEGEDYIEDDDLENDIDLTTGQVVRKSRGYRRDKVHGYADWSMNNQKGSGYLSDYGRQAIMPRGYNRRPQRRPRSATALMHTSREDIQPDHTRKYSNHQERPDEEEYAMQGYPSNSQYYMEGRPIYEDSRYQIPPSQMAPVPHPHQNSHKSSLPAHMSANYQNSHHPNSMPPPQHQNSQQHYLPNQPQSSQHPQQNYPPQQQGQTQPPMQQQGYCSDGSETMSVHSCNSMPMITTINRRNLAANAAGSNNNTSFDEPNRVPIKETKQSSQASSSSAANSASNSNSGTNGAPMKERKKSLMTRFIPGRGAGGAEAKRTGFARSEEVGIPENMSGDRLGEPTPPFLKQASKESTDSAHSDNWLPILADGQLGSFVENLGPGQIVGRQVLASPVLGEIHIGLMAGRSGIDVEVIRAKNLVVKPGGKICPAPYVKVYLMDGKQCLAKAKTSGANKTTCPLFQQHLIFNDSPKKKILQVTVLGDYGRMERKVFMGITQIRLDDLELSAQPLFGWYKLFHSSSLAGTGPVRKDSDVSVGSAQQ